MKINKNIKALFTLSKFLANYCWLYFLFLAIASLFPLNHYINSATQATLLILCVPLLILQNFLTTREIKKMAYDERVRFLTNNITFPNQINFEISKFKFNKLVSVLHKEKKDWHTVLNYDVVVNEGNYLIINYFKEEIGMVIQIKYKRDESVS